MKRNREIEIANMLIKDFKAKGFQIHKYYARTTMFKMKKKLKLINVAIRDGRNFISYLYN